MKTGRGDKGKEGEKPVALWFTKIPQEGRRSPPEVRPLLLLIAQAPLPPSFFPPSSITQSRRAEPRTVKAGVAHAMKGLCAALQRGK